MGNGELWPSIESKPPQPIAKNIVTVDYVRDTNRYANFGANPSTGSFWANGWNITLNYFYPNVTTLRSGLCCRNSVCRLSVCLSVICRLSSVTLVHPTQEVEAFGNISSPLCTLVILWPPYKILRRSSQGNPSVGGVKRTRGIKIERFRTYRRLYLINGTR